MAVLTILVVDDNAADRRLIRLALQELGVECTIDEADGAKEALENLAQNYGNVDVVLLDGRLNGEIATHVIDHMKQDDRLKGTHIVVLTGRAVQR
jgi:CheY-like chemotaxis protein